MATPYLKKGETFNPQVARQVNAQPGPPIYDHISPPALLSEHVHHSWTDVIPPNGVAGHPNLLADDVDRGVPRPFSAAVVIRKPTEVESSRAQRNRPDKGNSEGGQSSVFKPSLQPSGLSKFVSASVQDSPDSNILLYAFRLSPTNLSGREYPHKYSDAPSILANPAPSVPPAFNGNIEVPEKPELYLSHFTNLLALELASLQRKAFSYRLYEANLVLERPRTQVVGQFTNSTLGVWTIHVPGIREDAPRIFLGDVLLLRRIYPETMVADETVFEVRVIGSLKREGKVYVDSDILWTMLNSGVTSSGTYQVEFKVNSQQICLMQDAIDKSATPEVVQDQALSAWFDHHLNEKQKKAVNDITKKNHPIPYLLFGPAGTGKTKTLVEAVLQINRRQPNSAVLVCAPSNSAADTIATRLANSLNSDQMLRLQNPTRTTAEVPQSLRDAYCNLQDGQFILPGWQKLMQYRVIVTTCTDAGLLANGRLTNAEILRLQGETGRFFPTTRPAMRLHWTHLIIDEAAQATEPETLIPLSVVTPGGEERALSPSSFSPTVVLCGDIKQLPAIVSCDQARKRGLDISLLERLMDRPVYQQGETHITSLEINYRSHSGILWLPNALFYNNRLQACDRIPLSQWRSLPNPRIPIVVKHVGDSNADDWVEESEIAVITPWREQVLMMRRELRDAGLWDVNIGNVEAHQGAEYRCVVISCVRSRSEFVSSDGEKGMGFIYEPKRFNVAITRAKELLVVIGNCEVHKEDPSFRELLRLGIRHELCVAFLQLPDCYLFVNPIHSYIGPDILGMDPEDGGISNLE
ncbi:hypothetical protein QFC19_006832 [Naganishia cerealis]|uniref:Uncharacterized protein n=1 Tax=Naganishia cerealis TaxID=610337 RepID=A0ACC2VEF6_9TREE|nr:hypothetical protein QFC19_006832 [Naganishia cerealis]